MKDHWNVNDIPDQSDRVAIVTGANTGIGYETARALAKKGAHVVLACRNKQKGEDAVRRIKAEDATASAELMQLDLSSLDAVRQFAEAYLAKHDRLDLLINNAGVMVPPFSTTEDGFELQFGVNVLGHFALTGLLLDRLTATSGSRVVTVSSLAHRQGEIDFGRILGEDFRDGGASNGADYKPWRAYGQSKLGDLVFAIELQRRLAAAGHETISLAAHPGFTKTDLQRNSGISAFIGRFVGMEADRGALPTLYAATAPEAEPGGYYGPDGFYEMRGDPAPAKVMPKAKDEATARRLWETAEDLTDVRYLSDVHADA
ncbi:MAG: oxidoreductase [Rhodothermales bacterium]